jgi:hypothetical protein
LFPRFSWVIKLGSSYFCRPLSARVLVTLGASIEAGELCPGDNCVIVESAPHTVVMCEAARVVAMAATARSCAPS